MKDGITGQAINLMSNDVYKFDWGLSFLHDLYSAPIKTILAGYFIYQQIGYAGIIGMALLLLFIPIQGEVFRAY
jgi:ATP-binding cassette subfamily C (CFTR/MRP) protein 4